MIAATEPIALERLRHVPILQGLPAELIEAVLPHLREARFKSGDAIVGAADYLDGIYYVVDGELEARAPGGDPVRLLRDDLVGESGALTRYPVGVDVKAIKDSTCMLIRTPGLWTLLDSEQMSSFKERYDERYRARTLRTHLRRVEWFAQATSSTFEALVAKCELVSFKPNKEIAVEGQPCEHFYLVRGGHVRLSARSQGAELAVTYLRPGDWTGEAAILLDESWPFTLSSIDHVELVRIPKKDLLALFPRLAADQRVWDAMITRLTQRGRVHDDPRLNRPLQFAVDTGLIRGRSVLTIDLSRCTRCDECVRACADAHDGTPRFVREGLKFRNYTVATACYHCSDPVCMIGCPTGAIQRPLGSKEVMVDAATCIGCGNCVNRCPWGNILQAPIEKPNGQSIQRATKCDLCAGRADGPACVQMCPQGCATRVDFSNDAEVERLFGA